MTTRAIVTSQPDVECYVCERRLLRGEHPEVFLADGQPRTVCELCAPRAAHEGWPREHEGHALSAQPPRGRRGRGLFARLRHASASEAIPGVADEDGAPAAGEQAPYDLAGEIAPQEATAQEQVQAGDGPHDRAVDAFNASAYPRRVASLARSLGAPEVSVLVDHDLRVASILVAWELCWYRYRIDLDEEQPEVTASAQGTELSQLGAEERQSNAVADERGGLSLIAASV